MAEVTLKEIHKDLEMLKRDISELKTALLGEGELSDWAKQRIEEYLRKGPKKTVSQEEVEKEFL